MYDQMAKIKPSVTIIGVTTNKMLMAKMLGKKNRNVKRKTRHKIPIAKKVTELNLNIFGKKECNFD